MLRVQFYGLLRLRLGRETVEIGYDEGATVGAVLRKIESAVGILIGGKLLDGSGAPFAGTIILVNRRNVLHLEGLKTPLRDGDVVALFPPGAGG